MYFQGCKSFVVTLFVFFTVANGYCLAAYSVSTKQSDKLSCRTQPNVNQDSLTLAKINHPTLSKCEPQVNNPDVQQPDILREASIKELLSNTTEELLTAQTTSPQSGNSTLNQNTDEPRQLEGQPSNFPQSSPRGEPLLDQPEINYADRLERLIQRLRQTKKTSSELENGRELELRVRQRPLPPPIEQLPLPQESPSAKFKPIGSLQAQIGYFQTDNIFSSSIFRRDDSLFFYGLRLASAYFPLGGKTYLGGSIEGNSIIYLNQSKYNYNQLLFNVDLYKQLTPRMYAQLSWSNQQLFYAKTSDIFQAGDRFFNDNSFQLSLGRRDPLTDKLILDSFYGLTWSLTDPDNRSRIINSFWLSLSYYLQKPLQIGLNYQLNLSDFTKRDRSDEYHRIYGNVFYRLSDSSSFNLQGGFSFGDSTLSSLDFNSWFLNFYYNLKIGEF